MLFMPNFLLSNEVNQNTKIKTSVFAINRPRSRLKPQVLTCKSSNFGAKILSAFQVIFGV